MLTCVAKFTVCCTSLHTKYYIKALWYAVLCEYIVNSLKPQSAHNLLYIDYFKILSEWLPLLWNYATYSKAMSIKKKWRVKCFGLLTALRHTEIDWALKPAFYSANILKINKWNKQRNRKKSINSSEGHVNFGQVFVRFFFLFFFNTGLSAIVYLPVSLRRTQRNPPKTRDA